MRNKLSVGEDLCKIARSMLRVDGDRDEYKKSDLTVERVCEIARFLKEFARDLGYDEPIKMTERYDIRMRDYKKAIVKFNGGFGALLCSGCRVVLREGADHTDIAHYCDKCGNAIATLSTSNRQALIAPALPSASSIEPTK